MKQKINGWDCEEIELIGRSGRLKVYFRLGEGHWKKIAEDYWSGSRPNLTLVQSSRFAVVHRDDSFYYKRFLMRDKRDVIKHIFFPSRGQRALRSGLELESAGFHPPRPVCLIEQCRGGIVTQSALITEAISNAPNMRDWLNNPTMNFQRKRKLLKAFAQEVGTFHANGFHHGDMRIGNILCRELDDGTHQFFWLDNERNTRQKKMSRRHRIHNLMQVNMERTGVTLADRMRFWRTYANTTGISTSEEKSIMRDVIAYTRMRWKKRGWI